MHPEHACDCTSGWLYIATLVLSVPAGLMGKQAYAFVFAASHGAATLTCFLPRFGIATHNTQNNLWRSLGLAARHRCGDMCSVTSKHNWKECYGNNILLSRGQHNVTAVWAVYLCPASTSFTWHGYCTFVKHPGTLLPRCMLCRALDRKHRQMGFFLVYCYYY